MNYKPAQGGEVLMEAAMDDPPVQGGGDPDRSSDA